MLMRFDPFRDVDRLTQALMSQGSMCKPMDWKRSRLTPHSKENFSRL